jgi:conjugal transfer mating pair stabilization protein TraG
MEHVITTYGGGELFALVFSGIASLFNTNQGLLIPLIHTGLMIGLVYVILLIFFQSQINEGFKWLLWVIVATNLIFLPKTTIFIDDPLANKKFKVDNVPFALGSFASLVSQIGLNITQQFESVFTLPDYMPYNKTGTVFASTLMNQVGQFRIVDPVFKGNMERFVNQCVVYGSLIGHKYTLKDLQNTPDIWTLVSNNASSVLGFLYKEGHEGGEVITCKAGAIKLNELWVDEIAKATGIYGSRVGNQTLTKASFFTHLQNGFQLMTGISESADKLLRQEMMINAIEESSNNKLSELGSASNYAATKALLQQRSAYTIAGDIAARTLPLFKNVIEALSYALFIFIVMLALLPNGYRILLTYTGILVWTQLWAPLYAVLNLIMTLYGSAETKAQSMASGLTLLNSSAIINAHADMMTLAAWFSVSIPFLSYGILKQGAGTFVGLAHHLGSAMQQAASSSGSEVVSGNISLGNVSMGTQAYQNSSAFQHNTSPSFNASHFKAMSGAGIEQSTFAEGVHSLTNQSLSKLGVQIMGSENMSHSLQTSYNEAKSLFESKSIAASKATESAFQSATSYLSQVTQTLFKGEDYKKNVTTIDAETLQNFKGYINDLRQSTGMTEAQAVEAAMGVTFGFPGGIGPHASTNFSNVAARQKGIEAAASIAHQKNYTDSLEKVISASKDISESESGTKGTELSDSILESLNKAKSLREEASLANNRIETFAQDLSSSQSKSMIITQDLTQDILDYIAVQPINPGPTGRGGGRVGYETARRIIENGGAERDAYMTRFLEENPQYTIESIQANSKINQLSEHYNLESQTLKNESGVEAVHEKNRSSIQHQSGDPKTQLNTQSVKQDVTNRLENCKKDMEVQKKDINQQEETLRKKEEESKEKSLTGIVLNNSIPDSLKELNLQTLHGQDMGHN